MSYHRIGKGGSKYWGKKAAGILFTDGKKILLLKRSDKGDHGGTWGIPGGKHESGETDIANAIRETKEETGLLSIPGNRIDSLESKDGQHRFVTYLYRVNDEFDIDISDEHTDWKWVEIKNVERSDLHPKFRDNWDRYLHAIKRKLNFSEWMAIC